MPKRREVLRATAALRMTTLIESSACRLTDTKRRLRFGTGRACVVYRIEIRARIMLPLCVFAVRVGSAVCIPTASVGEPPYTASVSEQLRDPPAGGQYDPCVFTPDREEGFYDRAAK